MGNHNDKNQPKQVEGSRASVPENDSKPPVGCDAESGGAETQHPREEPRTKTDCRPSARRATGPRTQAGKQRSRKNAITHGIFAGAFLDEKEGALYRRLERALRADRQSLGAVQELRVSQLAMLYVRLSRVLKAEAAEISQGIHSAHWNDLMEQLDALKWADSYLAPSAGGLLEKERNPLAVSRSIDLLMDWRKGFAESGFNFDHDMAILVRIYGYERLESSPEGLPSVYRQLSVMTNKSEKTEDPNHSSPEQNKKAMLDFVDREIERLTEIQTMLEKQQTERMTHEARAQLVPVSAERLMRYETWVNREIERTLNMLDRP
jgi:hypothetical protein